jgi:DNA-binding transcriptional ArsR family regulator/uncharacterized protein YndB with AHSA1/START domain
MDAVFKALSDPSRRELLDRLHDRGGQNLQELGAGLDMARQSVTKHLDLLVSAGLVVVVRQGRERLHYLNAAPINDIAERWINRYDQSRVDALSDLKRALEETPMSDSTFAYTMFVHTTPERMWAALTQPEFTRRYWGLAMESDWEKGSTYAVVLDRGGVRIESAEQVVLESDPFRRLAYTWHTFTPEWAAAYGIAAEDAAALAAEPRSKVAFDIEQSGPLVKLTVIHDCASPDSLVLGGIRQGWPAVLGSLKTLLETGEPLPDQAA